MPIRKYGNEVFRMKYALLFFSFFLVFVLNSQDASSQVQQNSNNYCVAYASSKVGKGNPRWGSEYESCLKQMGQRATQSGQYVQKYHFDNPQYQKCLTQNGGFGKASEKDIDACMAKSSVKQPAKENKPQATNEKCHPSAINNEAGNTSCFCEAKDGRPSREVGYGVSCEPDSKTTAQLCSEKGRT